MGHHLRVSYITLTRQYHSHGAALIPLHSWYLSLNHVRIKGRLDRFKINVMKK